MRWRVTSYRERKGKILVHRVGETFIDIPKLFEISIERCREGSSKINLGLFYPFFFFRLNFYR